MPFVASCVFLWMELLQAPLPSVYTCVLMCSTLYLTSATASETASFLRPVPLQAGLHLSNHSRSAVVAALPVRRWLCDIWRWCLSWLQSYCRLLCQRRFLVVWHDADQLLLYEAYRKARLHAMPGRAAGLTFTKSKLVAQQSFSIQLEVDNSGSPARLSQTPALHCGSACLDRPALHAGWSKQVIGLITGACARTPSARTRLHHLRLLLLQQQTPITH